MCFRVIWNTGIIIEFENAYEYIDYVNRMVLYGFRLHKDFIVLEEYING